ncbi:MAG: autotransporter-associated beta strand repeat-containing protein [Planctomycetia bacterium]
MNRLFSPARRAALLVVCALATSHAATAATTTYPNIDTNEWDATSGIAAGDTVILQGAATYTSSVSPVVNNGTLQFDVFQSGAGTSFNNPYIYSLNTSGSGVVQATTGYTSLTGTNSYTGGTTIDSGAALIVTTSSLPGAVTNGGFLRFQQDFSGTFAGAITGGGTIQRYGAGTVTLTGTNSQAFEIYNDAFGGRLVGNTDSLKGGIQNTGGNLEFHQTSSGTFLGTFDPTSSFATGNVYKTGAGDLTLTGNNRLQSAGQSDLFVQAGRVVGTGSALDFNGTIDISSGAELRIDEPVGGSVYQMQTEIIGSGALHKTGAGTIDMTQVTFDYGGITTVAQGKVVFSGRTMPRTSGNVYGEIRLTGSGTGNSAGIDIFTGGSATTVLEYPGVISGGGSVTVSGNDTLELTGANTYTGGTYVTTGVVRGTVATMPGPFVLDNAGSGIARVEFVQNTNATMSSAISGSGELLKSGTGTLTITSGTSTIAGVLDVTAGTLVVNRSMPNIARTRVRGGATLAGSGTVGTAQQFFVGVEVEEGTLKPGNSAGIISTNDLSMSGGQTAIEWELMANTASAAARGTSYDGIDLSNGNLTINNGATLNLVFNASGSNVNWWNPLWDQNQSWVLIDGVANPSLTDPIFSTLNVSLDAVGGSLATLRPGATFTTALQSGDVVINYAAAQLVPEPSTFALAAIGCLGGLAARRRRKPAA